MDSAKLATFFCIAEQPKTATSTLFLEEAEQYWENNHVSVTLLSQQYSPLVRYSSSFLGIIKTK